MLKKFLLFIIVILLIPNTGIAEELIAPQLLSATTSDPAIVNVTFKADSGDAIGIYGCNFVNENAKTTLLVTSLSNFNGETEPLSSMTELTIYNLTNDVIQSAFPTEFNEDSYVGFVKVGDKHSKPFFINTPEVDWLAEREICAGLTSRIFGRNFVEGQTEVFLCDTEGTAELSAVVINVTPYTIDFLVPDNLSVNKNYIVKVKTRGYDQKMAVLDDKEAVLCMSNTNFQEVKIKFGVELAWASQLKYINTLNVKTYGAKGDGETDDTKAIEATISAAKMIGGSVIYFPEGIYNLTELTGLKIPENSIIMGDGKDKSVLLMNKRINSADKYSGIYNIGLLSELVRPADDTIRRIGGYTGGLLYADGNNVHFFAKHISQTAKDGSSFVSYSNKHLVIEDCHFDITHQGPQFHSSGPYDDMKVKFTNNYVRNTQRSMIWCGGHTWIENCFLEGDNGGDNCEKDETGKVVTMEHRITEMSGDKIFFGNNRIIGTIGDQRMGKDDNSGEGICNQATYKIALSAVSSATDNTITDITIDYDNLLSGRDDYAKERGKNIIGAKIAIISGKGLGQIRRITGVSDNTVTIDKEWDIVPAKNDSYTIDAQIAERYIIVNNQIDAKTRKGGIMFYHKSYDNIIENNISTNSGGIWFGKTQVHDDKRNNISYFNYISENDFSNGVMDKEPTGVRDNALAIGTGDDGGHETIVDTVKPTTSQYGNMYKNNILTGRSADILPKSSYNEIYVKYNGFVVSTIDKNGSSYPFSKGLIFSKNTATNSVNGITLSPTSHDTLLYKNNFSNNKCDYNNHFSMNTVNVLESGEIIKEPLPYWSLSSGKVYPISEEAKYLAAAKIGDKKFLYMNTLKGLVIYDVTDANNPIKIQTKGDELLSLYEFKILVKNGYLLYITNNGLDSRGFRAFKIKNDGTIDVENPDLTVKGMMYHFEAVDDLLIVGMDTNLDIYCLDKLEKLGRITTNKRVRSAKTEKIGDGIYRVYHISQFPYQETINGITYTCEETFGITDFNINTKVETLRFSGKPKGDIWPGFGEYTSVKSLTVNWGVITLLKENTILLNTVNANFNNYSLIINASNVLNPVITSAYKNDVAISKMLHMRNNEFLHIYNDGGMQIYNYGNVDIRDFVTPKTFAATGKKFQSADMLGNYVYGAHNDVFTISYIGKNMDMYAENIIIDGNYNTLKPGVSYVISSSICNNGENKNITMYFARYKNDRLVEISVYNKAVMIGSSTIQNSLTISNEDTYIKIFIWENSKLMPLNTIILQ